MRERRQSRRRLRSTGAARRRSSSSSRRRYRAATVVRVVGDGNCLYRALAHPDADHVRVRARVARHIDAHWEARYRHYVPEPERARYRRSVGHDGVWGDELSLRAYADAEDARVQVYDAHTRRCVAEYGPADAVPPKRLVYDGTHYDALA